MKYKHAESEGWYYQIDEAGNQGQSWNAKNSPGMEKLRLVWLAGGNEMLPLHTAEDLAKIKADKSKQALESQLQACKTLLNDTQYIVDGDCDFPQEDIDKNKVWRVTLKKIMRGGTLKTIPPRPY